jgi:hypothetical protein
MSTVLTEAELTAWQELARAAAKLRQAQRKAEASRKRRQRRRERTLLEGAGHAIKEASRAY